MLHRCLEWDDEVVDEMKDREIRMYIRSRASLARMYQIKLSSIYTFECPILDMARLQFLFCEPQVKELDGVFRLNAHKNPG